MKPHDRDPFGNVTPLSDRHRLPADGYLSELAAEQGIAMSDDTGPWPKLHDAALAGLAGRVVSAATADSEADPAAVLMTFLSAFGALCGSGIRAKVGDTSHPPRIWSVLVGNTAKSRKGTSKAPVMRLIRAAEDELIADVDGYRRLRDIGGPLSTGEGLVDRVGDPKTDKDGNPVEDTGVTDKRLLIVEGEFAGALRCMDRDGNTLSPILRDAWDIAEPWEALEPLVKSAKVRATNPHICIVGHITRHELETAMTRVELYNGLANRILWTLVQRPRLVPRPSPMPAPVVRELGNLIAHRVKCVLRAGVFAMPYTEAFAARWCECYPKLSRDVAGVYGAVTARAEANTLRLAVIYALLAGADAIDVEHLRAALAVWGYCNQSARCLFDVDPAAVGGVTVR